MEGQENAFPARNTPERILLDAASAMVAVRTTSEVQALLIDFAARLLPQTSPQIEGRTPTSSAHIPIVTTAGAPFGYLSFGQSEPLCGAEAEAATRLARLAADCIARLGERDAVTETLKEQVRAEVTLRAVLEGMSEGVIVLDRAGGVVTINRAALAMHGAGPNTSPHRFLQEFVDNFETRYSDGTLMPAEEWPAARALRGEIVRGQEIHVRHHLTGESWIGSYSASPVRDADGRVQLAAITIHDITEQRRGQLALARREEQFREIAETLPQLVWSTRADGYHDYYNSRWYEYTGMRPGDTDGEGWSTLLHPDDIERSQAIWSRSLETGEPYEIEYRFRRRDGRFRWFLGRALPIHDGEGRIMRWFGTCTDIHDQRVKHESLRFMVELSESTRALRDPVAIMATTARLLGKHLRVSRCAYAEVESDEDTFTIIQDYTDQVASSAGTYPLNAFGPRAAADQRSGRTLVIRDVDRELPPQEGGDTFNSIQVKAIICCPLLKEGRLAAMMAVHSEYPRDWTEDEIELVNLVVDRAWSTIERARSEGMLRALNQDLERRVAERTAELATAVEELEGFTYTVSHDLRSPLRAIMATSVIVQEDYGHLLPAEANEELARQGAAAKRMGVLIDELLRLTRLTREEMIRSEFDISALAREVVDDLISLGEPPTGIEFEIQPHLHAYGDARLVRFVLLNLLENAIKFSPNGGRVRFAWERNAYSVRDEGVGFDMAHASKLFLPFERLHGVSQFPGTGIGLANVERIVKRHGGRVWAESRPGDGAAFYFTLG